jgi:hypothetical protein
MDDLAWKDVEGRFDRSAIDQDLVERNDSPQEHSAVTVYFEG